MSEPQLFPPEMLRSIIAGASSLEVRRLRLADVAEAHAFLACYGFDWDLPAQRDEVRRVQAQAVAVLEDQLLDPDERLPDEVRDPADIRQLLLVASRPTGAPAQAWGCALLRVMHAVVHAGSALHDRYGPAIRTQIVDRFRAHVHGTGADLVLGSGPDAVPLADFEVKSGKPFASSVMKLLHKPENVAADIFDRLGVRVVTRSRFDALLAVRYLRIHNVIMFANVKPTRSPQIVGRHSSGLRR